MVNECEAPNDNIMVRRINRFWYKSTDSYQNWRAL